MHVGQFLQRALATSAILALIGAQTATAQALTGWGPFKFGQTVAEAAKAGGPTARVFTQAVEIDVEISGVAYTAYAVAFGPSGRVITSITLAPKAKNDAADEATCSLLFEPMVAMVTKKYGKPIGAPTTPANGLGQQQQFVLKDGASIRVLSAFNPKPAFGSACNASIEMTPATSPDAPRKMEF